MNFKILLFSALLLPNPCRAQKISNTPVTLAQHSGWVWSLSFSEDGRYLASAGQDKNVVVWDVAEGKFLRLLRGHKAPVTSVVFVGNTLFSSARGERLIIWDMENSKPVKTVEDDLGTIGPLAASQGKDLLALGGQKAVSVLRLPELAPIKTFPGAMKQIFSLSFSGNMLAVAGSAQDARIFDPRSGTELGKLTGNEGEIFSCMLSANGQLAATASADRSLRVFRLSDRTEIGFFRGTTRFYGAALSPDSKLVAGVSGDGALRVYRILPAEKISEFLSHKGQAVAVAWSPDGGYIATGGQDGAVRLWKVTGVGPASAAEIASATQNTLAPSATSQASVQVEEPVAPEKKAKSGGYGFILGIVFALLALGGMAAAGVFFIKKRKHKKAEHSAPQDDGDIQFTETPASTQEQPLEQAEQALQPEPIQEIPLPSQVEQSAAPAMSPMPLPPVPPPPQGGQPTPPRMTPPREPMRLEPTPLSPQEMPALQAQPLENQPPSQGEQQFEQPPEQVPQEGFAPGMEGQLPEGQQYQEGQPAPEGQMPPQEGDVQFAPVEGWQEGQQPPQEQVPQEGFTPGMEGQLPEEQQYQEGQPVPEGQMPPQEGNVQFAPVEGWQEGQQPPQEQVPQEGFAPGTEGQLPPEGQQYQEGVTPTEGEGVPQFADSQFQPLPDGTQQPPQEQQALPTASMEPADFKPPQDFTAPPQEQQQPAEQPQTDPGAGGEGHSDTKNALGNLEIDHFPEAGLTKYKPKLEIKISQSSKKKKRRDDEPPPIRLRI